MALFIGLLEMESLYTSLSDTLV